MTRCDLSRCLLATGFGLAVIPAHAEETMALDPVSVTATRTERATQEVPSAIAVIGGDKLDQSRMFNITDALSGVPGVYATSKNGGYDARLLIRGAGLKANFGVRELMVLRDGVPLTDPDSFTRLDFVDTADIARIEVTKGPGNLFATGSIGGTIHIISKSVFDPSADNARFGFGAQGSRNVHVRLSGNLGESQAWATTASARNVDNPWRRHNRFDSTQISIKHGWEPDAHSVVETEIAYTDADLELPGKMNQSQYQSYLQDGRQTDNRDAFKHSGRYSHIFFINSSYRGQWGDFSFHPRVYLNWWEHFHPVTGQIVDNRGGGVYSYGTDLEFGLRHRLFSPAELVAGVTFRQERDENSKRFKYRDVNTIPFGPQAGRITSTLSSVEGDLLETQDNVNTVYGLFLQESWRPSDRWLIDLRMRLDRIDVDRRANELGRYDYAQGKYVTGDGYTKLTRTFDLFSPSLGVSYACNDTLTAFLSLAQGEQVPFASELDQNPSLEPPRARQYEVGLKGRHPLISFDVSGFLIEVENEIVQGLVNGETTFQNAGRTRKWGAEFTGEGRLFDAGRFGELWLGASYAYSDFSFVRFTEVVSGVSLDRSGNHLPLIPRHQYSLSLDYRHPSGLRARLQADTWGEYDMDNANSETYKGYELVTTLNASYTRGPHELGLNIQNLTDKRYAVEATKDTRGSYSYAAGAPRSVLFSYRYRF